MLSDDATVLLETAGQRWRLASATPGLTGALLSTSDPTRWRQASHVFALPPIDAARLREVCAVLDP